MLADARGRGSERHYFVFRCTTPNQSSVENFMLSMGYDARKYFLQLRSDFTVSEEYPYHLMLSDNFQDRFKNDWVVIGEGRSFLCMVQEVTIEETPKGSKFHTSWEADDDVEPTLHDYDEPELDTSTECDRVQT